MKLNLADYQLKSTSRQFEDIEWTISYIFNRNDTNAPRYLVVGDSICNGYHNALRKKLGNIANLTFWASSYCVTDPAYLTLLDNVLNGPRIDLVIFNNGLHSLVSNKNEWRQAYSLVIQYILAKMPGVPLVLLNSTPLKDRDQRVNEINTLTAEIAAETGLPMIDFFSFCNEFDCSFWADNYHFIPAAIEKQADFLAEKIKPLLPETTENITQASTATGPSGAMK